MNKWALITPIVLLIALICGSIRGAVVPGQQQPSDPALPAGSDQSAGKMGEVKAGVVPPSDEHLLEVNNGTDDATPEKP